MDAHAALAAKWTDAPPLGVPERKIAELEASYGISMPTDFRLYLLQAVPSSDYMDDFGFIWWAADRLKNIPDECGTEAAPIGCQAIEADAEHYLIFADFLDWCYAYAICCSQGEHRGKIALIAEGSRFVADSFSQFVELALDDAREIHIGDGNHNATEAAPPPGFIKRVLAKMRR